MFDLITLISRALYIGAALSVTAAVYYLLKNKINKLLERMQQHQIQDNTFTTFIPHSVFHKTWRTDGGIIAELHLESSGKTGDESVKNILKLVNLSTTHDRLCAKTDKEIKDRSIG